MAQMRTMATTETSLGRPFLERRAITLSRSPELDKFGLRGGALQKNLKKPLDKTLFVWYIMV